MALSAHLLQHSFSRFPFIESLQRWLAEMHCHQRPMTWMDFSIVNHDCDQGAVC